MLTRPVPMRWDNASRIAAGGGIQVQGEMQEREVHYEAEAKPKRRQKKEYI